MTERYQNPVEKGKARRMARAERDRKVTEWRTRHPNLSYIGNVLEWIGLGTLVIVGGKVFLVYFGMKILIGTLISTVTGVEFVGGVVLGVPGPSQWPRMVRNLFRRNNRDDIKITGNGDSHD